MPDAPEKVMTKDELQARSLAFAIAAGRMGQALREQPANWHVAGQLSRSASAVGANYRAACRGRSRAEFIAKLGVVVEECDEAVYWLEYVQGRELLSQAATSQLMDEAKQLRAIFAASYGTARANRRAAKR